MSNSTTATPTPEEPRTPLGRLLARYVERLEDSRRQYDAAAATGDEPARASAAGLLDDTFVSGAYVRGTDREVRRLRRLLTRALEDDDVQTRQEGDGHAVDEG